MTHASTDCIDWADFFERHRDYTVMAGFYECRLDFSLEELYQAFKARLAHEQKMDSYGDRNP